MTRTKIDEVEALAASILNIFQDKNNDILMPPVPIVEICLWRGLSVKPRVNLYYEDMKLAGMLSPRQRAVCYEARDVLGRQHFSIAHELGHYEIHWPRIVRDFDRDEIRDRQFVDLEDTFTRYLGDETMPLESGVLFRVEGKVRIEQRQQWEVEANYFAQFIMLPEYLVRKASETVMGLPYLTAKHVLAHQFEVSDAAMDLRLKNLGLLDKFEESYERKFFLDIGQVKSDGQVRTHANNKASCTITIAPQSRLRMLMAETDQLTKSTDQLILNFKMFRGTDLNLFGVTQAVELALLRDFIFDKNEAESGEIHRSISCDLPEPSGHIVRHMGRLGLLPYFDIDISSGQHLVNPQAVVTGKHVLLRLTPINNSMDFEAFDLKARIVEWIQDIMDVSTFADLTVQMIFRLIQDVVLYSSTWSGYGVGYMAVELHNIYSDGKVGCRLLSTVGDIGLSMTDRLRIHFNTDFVSTYDAIQAYCFNYVERASLIQEITTQGGYFQVNSGDVTYHIGRGGKSFFTGLQPVPGLQFTVANGIMME